MIFFKISQRDLIYKFTSFAEEERKKGEMMVLVRRSTSERSLGRMQDKASLSEGSLGPSKVMVPTSSRQQSLTCK